MDTDCLRLFKHFTNVDKVKYNIDLSNIQNILRHKYKIKIKQKKSNVIIDSSMYHNQFVPKDILDEIKTLNSCQIINFNVNKMPVKIVVCYSTENINFLVKHLVQIICGFNIYANNVQESLDLNIYLTNHKKILPQNKIFTAENANSGSSYPGKNITIFRKEELTKVLFHELIHFYQIDLRPSNSYIRDNFKINGPIRINEAYTETWGVILHSLYFTKNISYFWNLLSYQIAFSYYQVCKILKYLGCSNLNNCTITQKTSIFSYYILKSAFFNKLDLFLTSKDNYQTLVKICISDEHFKTKIKNWKIIDNSMKMTLIQPDMKF